MSDDLIEAVQDRRTVDAPTAAEEDAEAGRPQWGRLSVLYILHFFNDAYSMGLLINLTPLIREALALTYAQSGLMNTVMTLSSALGQPLCGWLSDRFRTTVFTRYFPLMSSLFMSALPALPAYPLVLVALLLAGVGVAGFHPQAATMAGAWSGSRRGLAMGYFNSSGMIGGAIAPFMLVSFIRWIGYGYAYLAAVPAWISIFALNLLGGAKYRPRAPRKLTERFPRFKRRAWMVVLLFLVSTVRNTARTTFITFVPILLYERTGSAIYFMSVTSLFIASGAVGNIIGGYLSDTLGRRNIILVSLLLIVPCYFIYLRVENLIVSFAILILAGGTTQMSNSVITSFSQELLPEKPGIASSVVMGCGWGAGGLFVWGAGFLADRIGIIPTLEYFSLLPLVAAAMTLLLPRARENLLK